MGRHSNIAPQPAGGKAPHAALEGAQCWGGNVRNRQPRFVGPGDRTCKVPDCGRRVHCQGLCTAHRTFWQKTKKDPRLHVLAPASSFQWDAPEPTGAFDSRGRKVCDHPDKCPTVAKLGGDLCQEHLDKRNRAVAAMNARSSRA